MNIKEMKELVYVFKSVRAAEQEADANTATMASIIDAMQLVKTASKMNELDEFMDENSEHIAETRFIFSHSLDCREREDHLLRVMEALIKYDEGKAESEEICIGNDTNNDTEDEEEEEEYW